MHVRRRCGVTLQLGLHRIRAVQVAKHILRNSARGPVCKNRCRVHECMDNKPRVQPVAVQPTDRKTSGTRDGNAMVFSPKEGAKWEVL